MVPQSLSSRGTTALENPFRVLPDCENQKLEHGQARQHLQVIGTTDCKDRRNISFFNRVLDGKVGSTDGHRCDAVLRSPSVQRTIEGGQDHTKSLFADLEINKIQDPPAPRPAGQGYRSRITTISFILIFQPLKEPTWKEVEFVVPTDNLATFCQDIMQCSWSTGSCAGNRDKRE